MEEKNYKREANPTYFTAKGTLYELAASGNKDAIEMLKLIDMSDFAEGIKEKGDLLVGIPKEISTRMEVGIGCAVELRYSVVSKVLEKSGLKNFFDVACGYTPRALYCKNNGIDYVGTDVPIVVDEMNSKIGKNVKTSNHEPYISADATNPESIVKAADVFKGEVFISCEGLIMYLSLNELNELIIGIKEVLKKHGGAWYTSDLGIDYRKAPLPFVNNKEIEDKLLNDANDYKKSSDIYYFSNSFSTEESKINYFESKGLKVEKILISNLNIEIKRLEGECDEVKNNAMELYKTFYCWKMTLIDDTKEKLVDKISSGFDGSIKISHKVEDGVLMMKPDGRIDTLSSPEFLRVFDIEKEKNIIKSITIDASKLEYISSAGLRVILKMSKEINGEIVIKNANQIVNEIFSTTGFSNVVKML